jgi:hypothetical protein
MAMYSAIEAGASRQNLIARLQTHATNFGVRGQHTASNLVDAFIAMVDSTRPR